MSQNKHFSFISFQPLRIKPIPNTSTSHHNPHVCSTQSSIPPTSKTPITAPSLETLEADYKAKKATYKAAKAVYKAAKKATECKENDTKMKKSKPDKVQSNIISQPTGNISVCSGSSCLRHGSQAVATILTPKIPPNAKCMKMCGGIGPTICVDGVPTKVDLKAAVQNAIANATEKVKDKTAVVDIEDKHLPAVNMQ